MKYTHQEGKSGVQGCRMFGAVCLLCQAWPKTQNHYEECVQHTQAVQGGGYIQEVTMILEWESRIRATRNETLKLSSNSSLR